MFGTTGAGWNTITRMAQALRVVGVVQAMFSQSEHAVDMSQSDLELIDALRDEGALDE